jgi:hypothetical protein
MKNLILVLLTVLSFHSITFGQTTIATNVWAANRYLGFDASNGVNPLFFRTNAITRMRLNGTQNATLNGVANHNVSGYFGIGPNGFFNTNTPWAMLHLEGPDNTGFGGNGWRRWMNTGLFMRENSDGMYVGMMAIPETLNRSDAIISWSDDVNASNNVDKLRFIFVGNNDGNGGGSTNPLFAGSLYGYEYMRMHPFLGQLNSAGSPLGHIGIGPLFTETFGPQNRVHINAEDNHPTFMQITTQTGTGMTAFDGLKLGVQLLGGSTNGYLQWQENTPMIFQTDWDAVAGGTQNGERLRILSTGAPGVPAATLMGTNVNVTRVAMSYFGSAPITAPRTLLHMGANSSATVPGWMEYGAMTANSNQAIFVGITPTGYTDPNRNVVGFWNNQLVFITNDLANGPTASREAGRFSHATRNLGVGDFSPTGLAVDPTQRIDVDGNGRFRMVPAAGGQSIVLGITQGGNPDDIVLSRLIFPNDNNQVLLGDGTWGPINNSGGSFSDCLGNAQLVEDNKLNLNDFNLYFESPNNSALSVGYDCSAQLPGRFSVYSENYSGTIVQGNVAGSFRAENSLSSTGIFSYASADTISIAGNFRANSEGITYGVYSSAGLGNTNYGVFANAFGGNSSFGVYGVANIQPNHWAGYFVGDGYISSGFWSGSDQNLKTNIQIEDNALTTVMQLNPVIYEMKSHEFQHLGLAHGIQHGFISQEVQQVLPELVKTIVHPAQYDTLGFEISPETEFLGLNYNGFISLNTAAIIELNTTFIEQQSKIDDLNKRLSVLEECLLGILPMLCQMNNTLVAPTPEALQQQMRSIIDVELRNELAIVLDQNVPNPFAETTVITYTIPAAVTRAQIHFYDASGNLIKTIEINERGDGQLNVYGQDLSSGLYTYTLVADGQLIATKKMVKK